MDIFFTTFTAVSTLLIIGILGFWLLSRRIIVGDVLGPLGVLAIDIALPCLIFTNILSNFHPEVYPLWWTLPLWWVFITLFFGIMALASSLISRKTSRREFRFSLFFHNGIFFPLAIIASLFGTESPYLADLFLFTLFYPAFFFNTAPLFFGKRVEVSNLTRLFNPVLVATVVALAFRLTGAHLYVPEFVTSGLKMVGNMSIPLLMIILGGNIFLDMQKQGNPAVLETLKFIGMKNIVFPLITLGVLILLHPPFHIALIIMIQSAVPPITAVPILAEREGGDRAIVNQFMVASFGLSLITLPLMILLFSTYVPK